MATTPKALSPQAHPLRLEIFEPHPFLRRFRFMGHPRALGLTGLASLCLFLIAATLDGHLTQHSLLHVLCEDARSYLSAKPHFCKHYAFASQMSALRDIPSLVVIVFLPTTIPLMYRQWTNITSFLSAMDGRSILRIDDRQRVNAEALACNRYFRKLGLWNPLVSLAALLCVLYVVRVQTAGHVYPSLHTSLSGVGIAPTDWWLSISGIGVAGLFYFLLGYAVVYIILLQTIHGSRVVLLVWRTRNHIAYEADTSDSDGALGWSEVRAILFATWSLIMIHGLCLGLVALSLPKGHPATIVLAPLLFQWLVVAPIYLLVPGYATRRNISAWKRTQRAKFRRDIAEAGTDAEVRALEHKLAKLKRVRVNPYAGVIGRGLHYIGIIATIVFVIQIIGQIY